MNSIVDQLPFWHFDEEDQLMVFRDGSLGAGFKLTGFDLNCTPNEDINYFTRDLENLLLSFGEGYRFQLFYKLSSDVSKTIEKNRDLSTNCTKDYGVILKARYEYLKKNAEFKNYFSTEIYFFVRSKPFHYKKTGLFKGPTNLKKITAKDYEQHKAIFLRTIKQTKSLLTSMQVFPTRIKSEEWFENCFQYLNLERFEKIGVPKYRKLDNLFSESLCSQLALTDISADKNAVEIGNYLFKTVTLKTLPEGQTVASMVDQFSKLPFHFWISQNLRVLDQAAEKNKLQLKRRIAHSMASGSKNVSDIESESSLTQIEELLTDLIGGSEKLISMDFSVIVWGQSVEEINEKCDEVLKAFRSLGQAEGLIETLPSLEAFIKALPGSCEGLRHKTLKSSNAAHLMPLFASWSGNREPVCIIPDRDCGLFSLHPFAPELTNWNGIVFGGSGSGKSFNVTQLMLMFYGLNPRIVWIDNGASSKGMVESLNGEFLDLKVGAGISINLFDLPAGETVPTPGKVRLILAILEVILKDEDKKGLPKRDKALLEEAIYKTYNDILERRPTIGDLREILKTHECHEMRFYSETLYSWCGDSAYGQILDRQTNVKLSKDLVTIEVQSLNAHPELKDVLLLLLTSHIENTSIADFERPYLLIVDEAERLFQTDLAKQFVITCYRTWRKFNSGIWCLSQNYKDFLADKNLADSLLPNTSHLIILRQKKIDWKHFQEIFDFNDAQIGAIKSLKIEKGEYSEFFYLQDENQAVLRLVPEPLSYWIATTDAKDKVRIKNLSQSHPSLSPMEIRQRLAFEEAS